VTIISEVALSLNSVDKIYEPREAAGPRGEESLHGLKRGEIVALLGSCGCGKTSTLRMIGGFERVTHGDIVLVGRRVNQTPPARRGVVTAFEGYSLYPPLTVRDNITFALKSARLSSKEVEKSVAAVARLLDIESILDRYPTGISGGRQQRASLARALVRQADLYLLDEPMGQLEPQLSAVLRGRLKSLLVDRRMTSIFVTHDQTEANALADRVAVMEGGVLQQFGSQKDLRERPANLFVATFVGEPPMNVFESRVLNGDRFRFVIDGRPTLDFANTGTPPKVRATIGLVSDYPRTDAYRDHYACTGSGLNACMASAQLAWMKRWQPERIARAVTCFHCKDWLYFKLTGARVTDPADGNFTFGNYRTREYEPRLLPPMIDGVGERGRLSAAAAAETLLPEGLPVSLAYLDVVCTGLGGGLCDPVGDVAVSILGSTGIHMRHVPSPEDVRSGYTMRLPIERACASMQSNPAATLNIDWLMDMAREAAEMAGAKTSRAALLSGLDDQVLTTAPGQAVYHPYIFEAGERGPFVDPDLPAQFSGLSTKTSFAGLARAVFEGLAFAARDRYLASGSIPREVRLGGGAARSRAMHAILAACLNANVRTLSREELGASGAAMMAMVNIGISPNMRACAEAWVAPFHDKVAVPDPQLSKFYSKLYPVYRTIREAMAPAWAHLGRLRQEYAA
jgi:ABC-type sugar transport system ATPase subunit/sugar (pentulose or hexulose) kinase